MQMMALYCPDAVRGMTRIDVIQVQIALIRKACTDHRLELSL